MLRVTVLRKHFHRWAGHSRVCGFSSCALFGGIHSNSQIVQYSWHLPFALSSVNCAFWKLLFNTPALQCGMYLLYDSMQQLIFMLKIFNFLYCHCIVTESVVWKMITESQNGLGRELRDHLVPNHCLGQGCLVGPHPIQPNLIRQSAHSGEKA